MSDHFTEIDIISMKFYKKLKKGDLYRMLRRKGVTIRQLAAKMDVTLNRIRQINNFGADGGIGYDYFDAINNFHRD